MSTRRDRSCHHFAAPEIPRRTIELPDLSSMRSTVTTKLPGRLTTVPDAAITTATRVLSGNADSSGWRSDSVLYTAAAAWRMEFGRQSKLSAWSISLFGHRQRPSRGIQDYRLPLKLHCESMKLIEQPSRISSCSVPGESPSPSCPTSTQRSKNCGSHFLKQIPSWWCTVGRRLDQLTFSGEEIFWTRGSR